MNKSLLILSLLLSLSGILEANAFEVTVYGSRNVEPETLRISNKCKHLPERIKKNFKYIYTANNCVLLWEDRDCKVNSMQIVTNQNKNFASLEFNDMFSSVSSCDYTRVAEFKLTDKNTKRKFLTI